MTEKHFASFRSIISAGEDREKVNRYKGAGAGEEQQARADAPLRDLPRHSATRPDTGPDHSRLARMLDGSAELGHTGTEREAQKNGAFASRL